MYYLSYAIPVVALIVALCFGIDPERWWVYLLVTAAAEGILYKVLFRLSSATEFLSGYVEAVVHLNAWTEKVVVKTTKYDSKGNSYTTNEVRYVEHPDQWFWYLNTGFEQTIPEILFLEMCRRWGTEIYYTETCHRHCVAGGGREECFWNGNESDTRTVTYPNRYKNPVRYSNSLFRSNNIDDAQVQQLGLFEYPSVSQEALSWMDLPTLSLKTREYFTKHENLDLVLFVNWLRDHLDSWKRKEFNDFQYLGTSMPKGKSFFYWIVSIILGVLVFVVCMTVGK